MRLVWTSASFLELVTSAACSARSRMFLPLQSLSDGRSHGGILCISTVSESPPLTRKGSFSEELWQDWDVEVPSPMSSTRRTGRLHTTTTCHMIRRSKKSPKEPVVFWLEMRKQKNIGLKHSILQPIVHQLYRALQCSCSTDGSTFERGASCWTVKSLKTSWTEYHMDGLPFAEQH